MKPGERRTYQWMALISLFWCLLTTTSPCTNALTAIATTERTPAQLRRESFERWLQLPESYAKKNKNKKNYQQRLQTLHPDHPSRLLGVTRKQRSSHLIHAAEIGNTTHLELLLNAGADVDAMDLYRVTSLHYAAYHGHVEACRLLLQWGAMVHHPVEGGTLRTAFCKGHTEILHLLKSYSGDSSAASLDAIVPATISESLSSIRSFQRTTIVIPMNSDHAGAGSFYIDNAFSTNFIEKLLNLHESLRKIAQQPAMQSTNSARRTHYCDTEGWLCPVLEASLQEHHHVFSHVRFISYHGEDAATSFLAPHMDHPVLDRSSGLTSTHTFILYLTNVTIGGETVLLDHIPAAAKTNNTIENKIVQCTVQPVRGRLFVFPHGCPHAGRQIVEGSKVILRGDIHMCC